jgi:hypothetical protein
MKKGKAKLRQNLTRRKRVVPFSSLMRWLNHGSAVYRLLLLNCPTGLRILRQRHSFKASPRFPYIALDEADLRGFRDSSGNGISRARAVRWGICLTADPTRPLVASQRQGPA